MSLYVYSIVFAAYYINIRTVRFFSFFSKSFIFVANFFILGKKNIFLQIIDNKYNRNEYYTEKMQKYNNCCIFQAAEMGHRYDRDYYICYVYSYRTICDGLVQANLRCYTHLDRHDYIATIQQHRV